MWGKRNRADIAALDVSFADTNSISDNKNFSKTSVVILKSKP